MRAELECDKLVVKELGVKGRILVRRRVDETAQQPTVVPRSDTERNVLNIKYIDSNKKIARLFGRL